MTKRSPTFEDDLLATAAHDLKTPLNVARDFIELTRQSGELNERQQRFLERAISNLDRMEQLIVSILDDTRLRGEAALQMTVCDLRTVIEDAVDMLAHVAESRQITVHLDVDPLLEPVYGDATALHRVIVNLLSNAIKYNRDGGDVWISAVNQPGHVQVSVRDSGTGIAPEAQSRVFDRFFRGSRQGRGSVKGHGLGLAISKTIIERHHGHIWLESAQGSGSTFTFLLPRLHHSGEGYDDMLNVRHEARRRAREGRPDRETFAPESAIESADSVDDNEQEASGLSESDSSSETV